MIGPFTSAELADEHLRDSLQVQGVCRDDAVDAWTAGSDAAGDATVERWHTTGAPWGLSRAVRGTEAVAVRWATGTPTGLSLLPAGRIAATGVLGHVHVSLSVKGLADQRGREEPGL